MAKAKTGKQVIAATKRAIDRRLIGGGAGATKTELRRALEDSLHPIHLTHALEIAGLHLRTANADELHELNYGLRWAQAYGKSLRDFYATPWGQDQGAEAQAQLGLAA